MVIFHRFRSLRTLFILHALCIQGERIAWREQQGAACTRLVDETIGNKAPSVMRYNVGLPCQALPIKVARCCALQRQGGSCIQAACIRSAVAGDIPCLQSIAAAEGYSGYSYQGLEDELRRPFATFLVKEESDVLQGFVIGWRVAAELQVMVLVVAERFRRLGIGASLMQELLLASVRAGDVVAFLEVRASNTDAYRLYSKLGFENVGIRKGYYGNGEDAILMEKRLFHDEQL